MNKLDNSKKNRDFIDLWKKIEGQIQALLWPEVCPFCEKVCRQGICPKCMEDLKKIEIQGFLCMKCGKPIQYKEQEYCFDCGRKDHKYDRGYSVWLHKKPASRAIYRFKYGNQRRYGYYFAGEMARIYRKYLEEKKIDVIIPIPLHRKRRRKRGYNQAEILAEELEKQIQVPVEKNWLCRKVYTNPQKELGRKERGKNLDHVFRLSRDFRRVGRVLLVDDIYTTGSTVDSAAEILKEQGVSQVYFLTITIGQGY